MTDGDELRPDEVPWWAPDPGAVYDVNPICGCHISARCDGCRVCTTCDGCYCDEEWVVW